MADVTPEDIRAELEIARWQVKAFANSPNLHPASRALVALAEIVIRLHECRSNVKQDEIWLELIRAVCLRAPSSRG